MSDILERAKDADLDLLAIIDWGKTKDLFGELIAEVERLRSAFAHELDLRDRHIESLEDRIKEPEAALEDVGDCQSIAYMLGGKKKAEENKILIDYIKRLEKAFLDSEIKRLNNPDNNHPWYPGDESYVDFVNRVKREAEQNASEALERIKEGGRDEN